MERVKLTARMAEFTAAIDFTLVEDGLDTRRFDELLAALPADLAARSEDWVASFLSEKQEGEAYNVLEKVLILPESLANPNVYNSGQRVELTEQQAEKLLSRNRPGGPAIVTVEAEKAAVSG